jgi:murein DD-endopeptidase MepM/ murein hydrolase activator NlpD
MRLDPILGLVRMHEGVDLGAPEGAPVLAAADGIVTAAGPAGGYGNMLHIRHAGGWATGYAHLSAFAPGIASGTRVTAGEVIAFVGHTGLATGPHLHFEVSLNGIRLDPMSTPVAQIGARGFFRWAVLIGQSRGIDLVYRIKEPLSHSGPGFNEKPSIIVPVEPITMAVEERGPASPPAEIGHITVNAMSAAQAQTATQLTSAPTLISDKQSFFKYSRPVSNRLPILGS